MNKLKIVLLISILSLSTFCNGIKKSNINTNSIEIIYFKGSVDTMTPINCGAITKTKSSFRKIDTILIDEQKYIEIVNQMQLLKELKTDSILPNCDVRIQCKINYANGDSVKLCIGEFNCLVKDGKIMGKNDSLVYLIRKYCGYYNYFPKEALMYFNELKQFGIPYDYKDLRTINNPDSVPLPPK